MLAGIVSMMICKYETAHQLKRIKGLFSSGSLLDVLNIQIFVTNWEQYLNMCNTAESLPLMNELVQ